MTRPNAETITEEERQMLLLALAKLAVERPGWVSALGELAAKFSTSPQIEDGRALFERFREIHTPGDIQSLASAVAKVLPAPLLADLIAHLDPLTPFVGFLRTMAATPADQQQPTAPAYIPRCATGHEWSNQFGDDWTPDVGTPCDCGQKKWRVL